MPFPLDVLVEDPDVLEAGPPPLPPEELPPLPEPDPPPLPPEPDPPPLPPEPDPPPEELPPPPPLEPEETTFTVQWLDSTRPSWDTQ